MKYTLDTTTRCSIYNKSFNVGEVQILEQAIQRYLRGFLETGNFSNNSIKRHVELGHLYSLMMKTRLNQLRKPRNKPEG